MWTPFSSICGLVSPIDPFFTLARISLYDLFTKDFRYSVSFTQIGSLTMALYGRAQNEFDIDIDTFVNCNWVDTQCQ